MSGDTDKLAQIEARVFRSVTRAREEFGLDYTAAVSLPAPDVLALVEIAKAARAVLANQILVRYDNAADPMFDLRDALSALDGDT